MDLSDAVPPDDTGSDTYRRYRYQAQIAFPYVLACALGEGVSAVLLEHIEDIAVLEGSTWSLKQVKTRDAGRGPWKASDVRANGGGLDSLYRAYRSLRTLDSGCVFQLLLEGATKNNDAIEAFCDGTAHENPDLVRKVHESLGRDDDPDCTEADVTAFLARVRVVAVPDTRSTVEARNLRLVAAAAPHLSGLQQESVYRQIMSLIDQAMAAAATDVMAEALLEETCGAGAKALRRADLTSIAEQLRGGVSVLLRKIVDQTRGLTQLAQKLDLGLASEKIVDDAKSLRAHASAWELEQMSAGNLDEATLEDVRYRLELLSNAVVSDHQHEARPADTVWNRIHERLHAAPREFDRNHAFGADPVLLMGELCEISDQCRAGWGVARA